MVKYTKIDNYKILNKLGGGGFSQVYRVEDIENKKQYAIKIADPQNTP